MTLIDSDDSAVAALLGKIAEIVIGEGGYIHPAITLRARNGSLSVSSGLAPGDHSDIFIIPESCLPSAADFYLAYTNGKISCRAKSAGVSAVQQTLMEAMLKLYEITRKVETHAILTPGISARSLEVWGEQLRMLSPVEYKDEDVGSDRLLMRFLASRFVKYTGTKGPREQVLIPLIDLLNHNNLSPLLSFSKLGSSGGICLSVPHHRPVPGSDEAFFCYGQNDAINSLLTYGFVDTTTRWSKSITTYLELPGMAPIHVLFSQEYPEPSQVPEVVRDIKLFYPRIGFDPASNEPVISFLIIPGANAPRSLRRVLEIAVRIYRAEIQGDRTAVAQCVESLERQLLAANEEYFRALAEAASAAAGDEVLSIQKDAMATLATHQLKIIAEYRQFSRQYPLQYLDPG